MFSKYSFLVYHSTKLNLNPSPCPTRTAGNLISDSSYCPALLQGHNKIPVGSHQKYAALEEKGERSSISILSQSSLTYSFSKLFKVLWSKQRSALLLCAENRGICSVGKDAQFPPRESHIATVLPSSALAKHYCGVAQVPQDSRAHGCRPTHSHFEPYAFSLHLKMLQSPPPSLPDQ